ncbi:MAG: putative PEP-binding protein [Planctomycetota bacterium]
MRALEPSEQSRMKVYRGEAVAAGVALGRVHLRGFGADAGLVTRIPSDQVELELNRLRDALDRGRTQIEEIRERRVGALPPDQLRIFDVHLSYLQDPLFVDEIEQQIMQERLSVQAAVAKLVEKYDRIFALVESPHLRQRAADLRDVGIRIQRNLGDANGRGESPRPPGRYILAAAKLTTADMFDLGGDEVEGIVAEEGGISSHAAILERSMGIPTLTGIRDLPAKVEDGVFVVIDATAGELVVDPDEEVLSRCEKAAARYRDERLSLPSGDPEHATRDGTAVNLLASCGSAGEVGLARTYGMDGIGVYRTELEFLAESRIPAEEDLVEHYREIVRQPGSMLVAFRLLDVSSNVPVGGRSPADERNRAMGVRGVRLLLASPDLLRLQVRALLRAAVGTSDTAILVPFVTSVADLTQVENAIVEERVALRKAGTACAESLRVAPIIEVPAAAFVLPTFLAHSHFVVVSIDDLQAHLLAADRDNFGVRDYYEMVHPALFELLNRMARECRESGQRLVLFGERAAESRLVPLYVGLGIRDFSVAPVRMGGLLKVLRRYTVDECRRIAEQVLQAPRALDVERALVQLDSSG